MDYSANDKFNTENDNITNIQSCETGDKTIMVVKDIKTSIIQDEIP